MRRVHFCDEDDVGCGARLHRGVIFNPLELSRVSHPTTIGARGFRVEDHRITDHRRNAQATETIRQILSRVQMGLRTVSYGQRRKEAQNIKI